MVDGKTVVDVKGVVIMILSVAVTAESIIVVCPVRVEPPEVDVATVGSTIDKIN